MTNLFDTHCHLNDQEAFPHPEYSVEEANRAGVSRMVVIGVDPESSERAVEIAEAHEGVYAAVGWHPNYTSDFSVERMKVIEGLLQSPKVVAIGEIGLDYHHSYASKEQQFAALNDQLELANRTGHPIVFHSRDAYDDLLDVLEGRSGKFVLHCFGGNSDQAKRAVEMGCFIGVDGPITYKKADELRVTIRSVPIERLLIETDAPWLTPHPYRGQKNHPKHVGLVAQGLADLWGVSAQAIADQTTSNALNFFNLSE